MKFILWAQAIDDNFPDHFYSHGRQVLSSEVDEREDIVLTVSKVIKFGSRVYDCNGVALTADRKMFVLEVPSIDRDHRGRISPIVCCGNLEQIDGDCRDSDPIVQIDLFAKSIGARVSEESFIHAHKSLEKLKKRYFLMAFLLVFFLITSIVVLFYLIRN